MISWPYCFTLCLWIQKNLCKMTTLKDRKLVFKTNWPSLSYQLSLRPLFCLSLSGRFTQVLLHLLHGPGEGIETCPLEGHMVGTKKNQCWGMDYAISQGNVHHHVEPFKCGRGLQPKVWGEGQGPTRLHNQSSALHHGACHVRWVQLTSYMRGPLRRWSCHHCWLTGEMSGDPGCVKMHTSLEFNKVPMCCLLHGSRQQQHLL